jgi:hypothetical protein
MADLFTVKTPLAIRLPDGSRRVLMEFFPHPDGLLGFELFWEQQDDPRSMIEVYPGEIKGDGPWKVGDAVLTVLACHGTDSELASHFASWQLEREMGKVYPSDLAVLEIAQELGALA